MKDALGDRIKGQYEDRTRFFLPRRTYTIIRVDGKAFHTLTKDFKRPFDRVLMDMMDITAQALCKEIQGAAFAYTQSDEISILLTDFTKITTNAWFDGNVQKMVSIAAACATMAFNDELVRRGLSHKKAMFDARVFTIPDAVEVENYFVWRQNDATRNSIQMAARAVYSHKELDGKSTNNLLDMLQAKGVNWNQYTSGEKRGRCIVSQKVNRALEYRGFQHGQAQVPETIERNEWVSLDGTTLPSNDANIKPQGNKWETPIFTKDRTFLRNLIPQLGGFALDQEAPKDVT